MIFAIALSLNFAHATVPVSDVITIDSPRGLRVVSVPERDRQPDFKDLVHAFTAPFPLYEFRRAFAKVGNPINEDTLEVRYRAETEASILKLIKLLVELMRLRGVNLAPERGTPVSYRAEGVRIPGVTTPGMIDACWECYGGAGNREYTASWLGLDSGSLEKKVSYNPRFTARQLTRGSAANFTIRFRTRERGVITVPVTYLLTENYLPFVADLPSVGTGERVFGFTQRVRINGSAALDPTTFGVRDLAFTAIDLLNGWKTEVWSGALPWIFEEVRERPVDDRPRPRVVRRALRGINLATGLLRVSRHALTLPGTPGLFGWFE